MSDGGKGDTQRPVDWDKFSKNFDEIFGKKTNGPEPETRDHQVVQPSDQVSENH